MKILRSPFFHGQITKKAAEFNEWLKTGATFTRAHPKRPAQLRQVLNSVEN